MTNQGNRAGEIALLVPNNLFNASEQFVYIYSRMGVNRDANAGAEQWGVRTAPVVTPNEGGTLSGSVYRVEQGWTPGNTEFTPLAGITINLFGIDVDFQASAITDADGLFEFVGVPAGSYVIVQDFDEPSQGYNESFGMAFATESGTPRNNPEANGNEILVDRSWPTMKLGGSYFTDVFVGT